jgi:GntR family transcriptional regulator/MocR family aminotransferase
LSGTAGRAELVQALHESIRSGRLPAGTRLPSSRSLAKDLGIARNTVADAYGQLVAEGWLTARQGSGTLVAERVLPAEHPARSGSFGRTGSGSTGTGSGSTRTGSTGTGTGSTRAVLTRSGGASSSSRYDLRPGSPDLSTFPRSEWLAAARKALPAAPNDAFGYGDPRGRIELRENLADYLARARGVRADPDRILICSGYVQALNLLTDVLRLQGATSMSVEEFGYSLHWDVIRSRGLQPTPVPVDEYGVRADLLQGQAALLTPAHQMPLGVPLAPDRRTRAVEWARETDAILIEDDYDGEFRYDRQPIGAVQGLDPDRVVYLGSASKSLSPALRIGWMVLPDDLVDRVIAALGGQQFYVNVIAQLTMADFISAGMYDKHIRRARLAYRRRRDRLVEALAPFDVGISGMSAGLHLMLTLPDGTEGEVLHRAGEAGIGLSGLALLRHPDAGPETPRSDGIVVSFGTPAEHAFNAAVDALCGVLGGVEGVRRSTG